MKASGGQVGRGQDAGGALDGEAVEEQFPGGDGGERKGGGRNEGKGSGLVGDDALVDEVQFGIGAGAGDGTGVEDFVSRLEQRTSGPMARTMPAAS